MKKRMFIILTFLMMFLPMLDVSAVTKVSCGNITAIPEKIPELTSFAITVVQIAVPVILVILGTLDLFKGITAGKEDEMKKGQQMFIKRLILGAIIFFIVVISKFLISIIADADKINIVDCIDCFVDSKSCKKYTEPPKQQSSTNNLSSNTNKTPSTNSSTNINKKPSTNSSSSNNKSPSKSSSSNTNKTQNADKNKISSNLFVGDSRTVGMCEQYKLCEGHSYIAKTGEGYSWFINTTISNINNKIKSKNYNIIILMGVNDVGSNGTYIANQYYNRISKLASTTWKKQNIIFVSVNPVVDGKSYAYMSGVNSFNKEMKSKIKSSKLSNLSYCDTISYLNISQIDSGDGLHYNKTGYQKIYNLIKNNCLK